jgi:hypothetical protein
MTASDARKRTDAKANARRIRDALNAALEANP